MDACLRGFSFMPETKVEVSELQYIESGELERTWKSSRRQRLKEQEQKVWDEFVKEQDVVKVVCRDDPYQFLHELPESCLKELMESELQKTKKEVEEEIYQEQQPKQGEGDIQRDTALAVTFADDADGEDCDMFHIFDDEKDDPSGPSGPEDEIIIGSTVGSPCTVRERDSESVSPLPYEMGACKSVENVSQMIESSIYVAKVKDLRLKIHDEILAIMKSLELLDVMKLEQEEVVRMCRRAAEFSARFNRIHMYQLQRQMQDVKRNTLGSLPFAKHTHFHAQMVRVASLHQNLLHAFQVFHKSLSQTACVRHGARVLHSLSLAAREVTALCADVPSPKDVLAPAALYDDEMLASCETLDDAVCNHSLRVSDFLSTTDNTSRSTLRKSHGKGKRKTHGAPKPTKSIADTRLSMYSLDTVRHNLNSKSSTSKENQSSGTSKIRGSANDTSSKPSNEPKPKSPKKSPRSRRPLMRAGNKAGHPRARIAPASPDAEITTMVEGVETCTSSHMSREPSPHPPARPSPRRPVGTTPRTRPARPSAVNTPRKSVSSTPRQKLRPLSSKAKDRRGSPKQSQKEIMKALSSIKSDPQDPEGNGIQITPLSKIQCTSKEMGVGKNFDKNNKIHDGIKNKNIDKTKKFVNAAKDLDKDDKNSNKANKDMASAKELDSVGNFDSKGFDSGKDCESFKDFESINDSNISKQTYTCKGKDVDYRKDDSTKISSKECKEVIETFADSPRHSSREERDGSRSDRERRTSSMAPAREVTRLLKQLCSGDATGGRSEKVSGAKNAQLLCVSGGSPRQPSTPQLLRILEETIQKKAPRPMYPKSSARDPDRFRMVFNIADRTTDHLFQYRTKFVQHMLASSMYANSAVGKPWEMICSISDKIIDELLTGLAKEMQIRDIMQELYTCETT